MPKRLVSIWLWLAALAGGQTQIDLNKQVRNVLPYSTGGTSASTQTAARTNVGTPTLVATDHSGIDIAEQVNNAFASFPAGTCGTVVIPSGSYTYNNTIYVPPSCILAGMGRGQDAPTPQGTRLIYNGPPATPAIWLAKTDGTPTHSAMLRDLSVYTTAGSCPNSGMLTWNPAASGTNKWQCYDGTTYTAAVPHLAGVMHGNLNPNVLQDGTSITVKNVDVQAAGPGGLNTQGAIHFGFFFNGCEQCVIESCYSLYADDGYRLGAASNSVTLINPIARLNRRSGINFVGQNRITILGGTLESNQWWGHTPDPTKYGAGLRGSTPDDSTPPDALADGLLDLNTHFEANTVDLFGATNVRVSVNIIANIQSVRSKFYNSKLAGSGCTIPDASLITIADQADFFNGCNTTGNYGAIGTGARVFKTDVTGTWVQKINLPLSPDRVDVWEQLFDSAGNADVFFRGGTMRLDSRDATALTGYDSPSVSFKGSSWSGAPTAFRWNFSAQARQSGGPDASALYLGFNGSDLSNRRFSFREDYTFKLIGDSPKLQIGGIESGGAVADNSAPILSFDYRSDGNTTGAHIKANRFGDTAGTGKMFFDVGTVQIGSATNPVTLSVRPSSSQSANQQEWLDTGGALTSYVSAAGGLAVKPSGGQPACNSGTRFLFWTTAGSAGVKDKVEVCAKDAADAYAWRTIY